MTSTSMIFVIDPPKLIIDSILLVASIRHHMPDIDLVCYCPEEKLAQVPHQLAELFSANNVSLMGLEGNEVFSPPYPHGNKLLAVASSRDTAQTLFLDTDILMWQCFAPKEIIHAETVSAAPEGVMTWGKDPGSWSSVYSLFGLDVPDRSIRLARSGKESKPYFNAGVVAFPNTPVAGFANFGQLWLDTAKTIDKNEAIARRRPWLDQISMPIAIARAGWTYTALEKKWNLSLSRGQPDPSLSQKKIENIERQIAEFDAEDPIFLHYHARKFLVGTRYEEYTDALVKQFTCFSSVEELNVILVDSARKRHALHTVMEEIRAVPREERTSEQKLTFLEHRKERKALKEAARTLNLSKWPSSILPAE